MKTLIFLLIASFIPSLNAQSLREIHSRLQLLNDSGQFTLDSSGFSQLPSIDYWCTEGKLSNNWHVKDLNRDGLSDLIFSGPCKPYYQTAIFLNNGKELELIFESAGKLVSLVDSSKYTRLDILKSSCCCDNFSDLIRLRFDSLDKFSQHTLSFHYNTKIDPVQNLGEKVVSGKLRTTPIVNDTARNDPCSSDIIKGNQLYEIKDKKLPIIMSKNGWDLVLDKKDKSNSIIGWVKE